MDEIGVSHGEPTAFTVYGVTHKYGTGVVRFETRPAAHGKTIWTQRPLAAMYGYESTPDTMDCLRCDYVSGETFRDIMQWVRLDFKHHRVVDREP
jgi:hypothetical protein